MVKGDFVFNLVIYTLVIAYILYINLSSYYNYNTSFLNSIVNLFQNWIFRAIFLLIVGFFALDLFPYGGFILAVLLTIAFLNTSMLMYKRHISEQFANQVMGSDALLAQALGRGENDGQHYMKTYEGAPINTFEEQAYFPDGTRRHGMNETFDGGYNQEDFADGDYEDDGQENFADDGEDYGDEDADVDGQEDFADEDDGQEDDGQEDFANEDDYEDDGQENFANEDDYEDDGQEDFANEDDYEDDGQEDFANEDDEDAQLEEDVIRAMGLDPNEKFTDCMKKEKFTNRTVNSRENCGPYAPLQRLPFNPQGYMDNTGLMGACAPDDLPEDDDMDGVYALSGIGYNFNMA